MSLMSTMLKDIGIMTGLGLEHWIHKTFIQFIDYIFGESLVRKTQMQNLMKRELYLISELEASIHAMRKYRALVKAGYDPDK